MRDTVFSWRIVGLFQLLQAPFLVLLSVGWASLLGLEISAVAPTLAVFSVLIVVATAWQLRVLLGPADTWRASLDGNAEGALIVANTALARAPTTFTLSYGLWWTVVYALATAYIWFALPDRAPLGAADLGAVALLLVAMPAGSGSHCFPVVTMLISREREAIANAIMQRHIRIPVERASLSARLIALMLAYVLASAGLIASAAWANKTGADRHATMVEFASFALQDVQHVNAGQAPTRGRIIDADELPPARSTAALDRYPELEGMHVVLDRRSAHVWVAAPLPEGRWVLVEGSVTNHDQTLERLLLIFGCVLVLWGTATAVINTRALLDPLVKLEASMQRLITIGDIRECPPLPVVHDDEIGTLTRSYNELVASLRELAEAAQVIAGGKLSIDLEHRGDLHDAFRYMVFQLDGVVVQLRETALEMSSTTAEIHAATQEQEATAVRSLTMVDEVRTTVVLLATAAREISGMAGEVHDNAERTLAMTDAMVGKITELSVLANGIAELLELIHEIAERSDLIALNGSLEASHVGEAGRGFALVAIEMRRLAERVKHTVTDVGTRVTEIKTATTSTVMATEESRKLATSTTLAAQAIANVTQQQSEGSTHATKVVETMAESVIAASTATTQTRAAAESLRERAEALDRLTRHFVVREDRDSD